MALVSGFSSIQDKRPLAAGGPVVASPSGPSRGARGAPGAAVYLWRGFRFLCFVRAWGWCSGGCRCGVSGLAGAVFVGWGRRPAPRGLWVFRCCPAVLFFCRFLGLLSSLFCRFLLLGCLFCALPVPWLFLFLPPLFRCCLLRLLSWCAVLVGSCRGFCRLSWRGWLPLVFLCLVVAAGVFALPVVRPFRGLFAFGLLLSGLFRVVLRGCCVRAGWFVLWLVGRGFCGCRFRVGVAPSVLRLRLPGCLVVPGLGLLFLWLLVRVLRLWFGFRLAFVFPGFAGFLWVVVGFLFLRVLVLSASRGRFFSFVYAC